jgi:hypothetical protein
MADDRLADLLADRVDRIERQRRVVEDHRGNGAAIIGESAAGQRRAML